MKDRSRLARRVPILLVVLAVIVGWLYQRPGGSPSEQVPDGEGWGLDASRTGRMVEVTGRVSRLLPDDRDGSRHQRFVVDLGGGRTLLIAHNIDLAPRVPVAIGDTVRVRGQYEWNERGGVLHWTHHDPDGRRRETGWIEVDGRIYE